MTICALCIDKTQQETNNIEKDIWGFYPYKYPTLFLMKRAFDRFIKNIDDGFYSSYNEDGYTYAQWYVYSLGRNNHKNKILHKQTMWLFETLSTYPFFKNLIKLGKRDDQNHNSLHHFLKYLDNYTGNFYQKKIIDLFLGNGLSLEDEDNEGYSGYDYINEKTLDQNDLLLTKEYTKKYKNLEKDLIEKIYTHLEKCENCNCIISMYNDISQNPTICKDHIETITKITESREKCINVFKKYEFQCRGVERHEHIVDIYKNIINIIEQNIHHDIEETIQSSLEMLQL